MALNIILALIFVVFSAFFSAAETAIFSLSNMRLRHVRDKHLRGKIVDKLLKKPTTLLSTIVCGNMLVNIGFSSLVTTILVAIFGENGLIFAIFVSGAIILFLGEIFPKTLAIYLAEPIALFSAPILVIFSYIFYPFIFIFEKIVNFFSFFLVGHERKAVLNHEEFKTAVSLSKIDGNISSDEAEMINRILEFKDTWVSEIVTPRIDIQGINISATQEEVLATLRQKKYSKFIVYQNSLDNIVGLLYAKDVFLNQTKDFKKLIRDVIFFPESKRIDSLLKFFLDQKEKIAVILDEYGGTEGLVTLEDIEEELFGEIYDEFEVPRELIEKIDDSFYRVFAKAAIKTVNLKLNINLPEVEDTLAGFLLSQMKKIPGPREKFSFDNLEFIIERVTTKRIVSVLLKINQ